MEGGGAWELGIEARCCGPDECFYCGISTTCVRRGGEDTIPGSNPCSKSRGFSEASTVMTKAEELWAMDLFDVTGEGSTDTRCKESTGRMFDSGTNVQPWKCMKVLRMPAETATVGARVCRLVWCGWQGAEVGQASNPSST
jgi:hypothetical protein